MNQLGAVNFPARGTAVHRAKRGRGLFHQGTGQSTEPGQEPTPPPKLYHSSIRNFPVNGEGYFMVLTMPSLELWNLPCLYLLFQARTQSTVSNRLFLLASDLPDLQDKPHSVPSGTKPTFQINNAEICEGQLNAEEKLWFCLTYHCGLSLPISRRFPMLDRHGHGHLLFIFINKF